MALTILDGPLGTELAARGVATPAPVWSAAALDTAPHIIAAIHADYAAAGATVHTACTFRTKRRQVGDRARALTEKAVAIARASIPTTHRVAGSIAPLEDCYRPDLSPIDCRGEHRELARDLARAGVDILLCECFPNPREALIAVEEAVATDIETWLSLTAGPDADLMTPDEMERCAREAVQRGAKAVLVNCVPADRTLSFVRRFAGLGVPFGAYANAGSPDHGIGWSPAPDVERYADYAEEWIAAGATIIGSCCGTSPAHIRALAARRRAHV